MAEPCVFCQVARGELPSHLVHRDEHVIAFLDRAPLLHGHVLVMPVRHIETLDVTPDDVLTPLFVAVRRMSVAVQQALAADGSFVAVNTRISQSVPHVHVHVVPRQKGDGLFSPKPVWRRRSYESDAQAAAMAAKIKAAYESSAESPPALARN